MEKNCKSNHHLRTTVKPYLAALKIGDYILKITLAPFICSIHRHLFFSDVLFSSI